MKTETRGQFLIDSLPRGSPLRALMQDPALRGDLDAAAAGLSEEEILDICDRRAAENKDRPGSVTPCDQPLAGTTLRKIFTSRKARVGKALSRVWDNLRAAGPVAAPFKVFVFGHTHAAEHPREYVVSEGSWAATVVNTGTWQRVVSPTWLESRNLEKRDQLAQTTLDDIPACNSYVLVRAGTAAPELHFWVPDSSGSPAPAADCKALCTRPQACK